MVNGSAIEVKARHASNPPSACSSWANGAYPRPTFNVFCWRPGASTGWRNWFEELFEGSQNLIKLINLQFVSQKTRFVSHKLEFILLFFVKMLCCVREFFYPWDEPFFIMVNRNTLVSEFRTMFFCSSLLQQVFSLFQYLSQEIKENFQETDRTPGFGKVWKWSLNLKNCKGLCVSDVLGHPQTDHSLTVWLDV